MKAGGGLSGASMPRIGKLEAGGGTADGPLLAPARATSDNGQTGVGTPWGKTTTTFAQATNSFTPDDSLPQPPGKTLGVSAPTSGTQVLHYVFGTLKKSPSNKYFVQMRCCYRTIQDASWSISCQLVFNGVSSLTFTVAETAMTLNTFVTFTTTLTDTGDPTVLGSEVLLSAAGLSSMSGTLQCNWLQITPLP